MRDKGSQYWALQNSGGRPVQDGLREAVGGRGALEPRYSPYFVSFLSLFQIVLKLLSVNSVLPR